MLFSSFWLSRVLLKAIRAKGLFKGNLLGTLTKARAMSYNCSVVFSVGQGKSDVLTMLRLASKRRGSLIIRHSKLQSMLRTWYCEGVSDHMQAVSGQGRECSQRGTEGED